MNVERDKFLTEAMDECYHEYSPDYLKMYNTYKCKKCKREFLNNYQYPFSTWEGFGKLWEWCLAKGILFGINSVMNRLDHQVKKEFINPDNFANAVYEYLKEFKK